MAISYLNFPIKTTANDCLVQIIHHQTGDSLGVFGISIVNGEWVLSVIFQARFRGQGRKALLMSA